MPVAVLNVRPSRQKSLAVVRIDNRNKDLALDAIGQGVLLYAPRDEANHGYFGKGVIAEVRLDLSQRRFMFIALTRIRTFTQAIPLEDVPQPIESLAYRPDGSIAFSYFSPGIRALTEDDQRAILQLETGLASPHGLAESRTPFLDDRTSPREERLRRSRAMTIRDARLRWIVLDTYGSACAICGDNFADAERGLYEVEVCHLQPLSLGGPDDIANAMPMCRTHHWAYDAGLFTLGAAGQIIVSNRMEPDLRRRFNGRMRAAFPPMVAAWPKAQHLDCHRRMVFQP